MHKRKISFSSLILMVVFVSSTTYGWGYNIFNRFRPEAHKNYGYGGAGAALSGEHLTPRDQLMEALIGEELLEEEVCNGRRCTSNEQCCPDHICMSYEGSTVGSCFRDGHRHKTKGCSSDLDCMSNQACEMGFCTTASMNKGYSESCIGSPECDFEKGLCCQLVRRHRQAPRKMCNYFKDTQDCIGHVESDAKRARKALPLKN